MYTFFDIETPNLANDKICSIGIIRSSIDGDIEYQQSFLVNPEADFDFRNISIHGIRKDDVQSSPTFRDIWNKELKDVFVGTILAAHSAMSDIRVLQKTLLAYEEDTEWIAQYLCTATLARRFYPGIENYRLPTVCAHLGVELPEHHNAMSDTIACHKVFVETIKQYGRISLPIKWVKEPKTGLEQSHTYAPKEVEHSEATSTMRTLLDVVGAIKADKIVAYEEAEFLSRWLEEHKTSLPTNTKSDLSVLINRVLIDGAITPDEENEMLRAFEYLLNPKEKCDDVTIAGMVFVLTGDYAQKPRKEIERIIVEMGGAVANATTKKTDYVAIGGLGSDKYSFGNYGSKVSKAMELQAAGHHVKIISEDNLLKALDDN